MIQIRNGLFETNSSSVHSMVLCGKNDYQAWIDGDKLFNNEYEWRGNDAPQFVTPEEAAQYDKYYPYPEMREDSWGYRTDFIGEDGEYHERQFLTFEEYEKAYSWDYETFDDSYTTPGGEEDIAFGYFGRNG
jgi:hypothetical protein